MCKAQYWQEKVIMNVETVDVKALTPRRFIAIEKKTCKAVIQDNKQSEAI